MEQPGYDALAELYAETFPSPYLTPLERHAVHAFAEMVAARGGDGTVVDIGCGPGDVTADLAGLGLNVLGVDPSSQMLAAALAKYPRHRFLSDDAYLRGEAASESVAAILARFSLIHVPPAEIPAVLAAWKTRLSPGGLVLVAAQVTDDPVPGVVEFDHAVAPAWRWNPDHLAEVLADAGFAEVWRTVGRPDAYHRFPDVHLVTTSRQPKLE